MTPIIYHPGTGTYMGLAECTVIELPDSVETAEEIEVYLKDEPQGTDMSTALILPMTAIDNAVLNHDGEVPDIEWRGSGDRTLWVGIDGLSVKLRREGSELAISVFDDCDDAAEAELSVNCNNRTSKHAEQR